MNNPLNSFGEMAFGEKAMKEKLPRGVYRALKDTIKQGKSLDPAVADVVANAMKDWAVEKGATHFTHWFQPMTGITAEKHDSFIAPTEGGIISEFSGKGLIMGEPDASSLPSGGIRSTFEARGYTAWDPSSYAFIKESTLYIPTAFYSYNGQALDKKTPLLRSMQAINKRALRLLHILGETNITHVNTMVGPEQEYFLIDKEVFRQRKDLFYCGRTLFGARPPKGQELSDHYYAAIKPRVSAYMREVDEELWKLGVYAKTEHNEAAPAQHELACVYTTTNISVDHNQLTMEIIKKVADRHNLVCLLHEKPFAGVNGSGKHNNWSIVTVNGDNIFEPGTEPANNIRFLLFLSAVISAVSKYQDLLRISVANASNDCRLGAAEAPPAIVSVFLGDELTALMENLLEGNGNLAACNREMPMGVKVIPILTKDNTDRNRTSPVAFTGNKFEFRLPGSSASLSDINTVINTAVADELEIMSDKLAGSENVKESAYALVREMYKEHRKILFGGNNYSREWEEEAANRGLLNLKTTVDAAPYMLAEKNIELYARQKVFSEIEIKSRCEIMLENYCKTLNIEALTMLEMSSKSIIPAVSGYIAALCCNAAKKSAFKPGVSIVVETAISDRLSKLLECMYKKTEMLQASLLEVKNLDGDIMKKALFYRDVILPKMQELRAAADEMEPLVADNFWPFPTYGDILFSV